MQKKKAGYILGAICSAGTVALLSAQSLVSTVRISERDGIGQNDSLGRPAVSANGNLVAFSSTADNLVDSDQNSVADVFVTNLSTGALRRVTVDAQGGESNGASFAPSLSPQAPNGFAVVAYASMASNLGRRLDQNGSSDIYYTIPRRNNFTRRISIASDGGAADGGSFEPSVTIAPEPNRILIAYRSGASNLTLDAGDGFSDIFLTTIREPGDDEDEPAGDSDTARTIRLSRGVDGAAVDGDSSNPQISGDGRFVVYQSRASNLVSGVTPGSTHIYLYDSFTGATTLVSRSAGGVPGNGEHRNPTISFRGTYISYISNSTNIVGEGSEPAPGVLQIFLFNRETGETVPVNTSSSGEPGNGPVNNSFEAAISPNGRAVFFSDASSNLLSGDLNAAADIFVKDLATGSVARVTQGFDGSEANGRSTAVGLGFSSYTSLTAIAGYLSEASNLIAQDTEGNPDIFVSTVVIPPAPLTRDSSIEVPPDLVVESDSAAVTLQSFDGATLRRSVAAAGSITPRRRIPRPVVDYQVEIYREREDGRTADFRRRLTRRATFTFRNLRPGVHVVRYRARIRRGDVVKRRTNYSPSERILIESDENAA